MIIVKKLCREVGYKTIRTGYGNFNSESGNSRNDICT